MKTGWGLPAMGNFFPDRVHNAGMDYGAEPLLDFTSELLT